MSKQHSGETLTKPQSIINFYDIQNIHELSGSQQDDIEYLKSLMKNGVAHYIDNISAKLNLLKINEDIFPLLITTDNAHDSYVCSPYGHYITLAPEGLSFIKNKWLKKISNSGLHVFGKLVKLGAINSAIYFNHSLFSTDLHSDILSKETIENAVLFLKKKFPTHSIIFRSINSKTCPNLQKNLKNCSFNFIASRQIYLTLTKNPDLFHARIIKSDLKLWKESSYTILDHKDFSSEDKQCVLDLYTKLAIDSHSKLNPRLNLNFIQLISEHPTFRLKALKKEGKIEGVVGYDIKREILLCSFFGYDKLNQNKTQIYRLLSTLLLLEAAENAKVFHQSAGASFFKTLRGAKGIQEYQAVYIKHLPAKQKITWHFLKSVINVAAVPFMKKY